MKQEALRRNITNRELILSQTTADIIRERRLEDADFEKVSRMTQNICGINLHDGKRELVQARLGKRLRQLQMGSFRDYLRFVDADSTGEELSKMVDLLTTNLTYFFREKKHLDFLRRTALADLKKRGGRRLRIWSAGCSSGEEPYSIAITLREALPDIDLMDVRILATDISDRMLAVAGNGVYRQDRFKETPREMVDKYFDPAPEHLGDRMYSVRPEIRRLVRFKKLNLMEQWPMRGQFDVVFCRNVMIYFDKPTQEILVHRFYNIIKQGGFFMTGHAESLACTAHRFKYVEPSVYSKA